MDWVWGTLSHFLTTFPLSYESLLVLSRHDRSTATIHTYILHVICIMLKHITPSSGAGTTLLAVSVTGVPQVSMDTPTADHVTAARQELRLMSVTPSPDAVYARCPSHIICEYYSNVII